ncbi:MAG TPA: hypothetical protein VHR42_02675, partial [Clostridia bacterium]|nr:hypothetical protein [Clostridia bacterium]
MDVSFTHAFAWSSSQQFVSKIWLSRSVVIFMFAATMSTFPLFKAEIIADHSSVSHFTFTP